ncbi:MAG: alkaline phosphatase family protein [Anaerolineae bacterium]
MRKHFRLMAMVVLLGAMAGLAYRQQDLLLTSAVTYRPPLSGAYPPPGDPLPRQVERVVLVIISGLGEEAAQSLPMPTLARLRDSGASAVAHSEPPSYRGPAWTGLISGAEPWLGGAPPLERLGGQPAPDLAPTIFDSARGQTVASALAGQADWQRLVSPAAVDNSILTALPNATGDGQIMDGIGAVIDDDAARLVVAQFNQLEFAAQSAGTDSAAYRAAAQQVDALLDQLVATLDWNRTTLIISADYGHIEQGGHGGNEAAVVQLPLIMAGAKVIPGNYSPVRQTDIAPTLAVLLGLSLPPANQGRPLLEMMQLSERDRAAVLIALAAQQTTLTEAYLAALGVPAPPPADLENATQFYNRQNFAGAAQLAQLLADRAGDEMRRPVARRQAQEARRRLPAALGGLAALTLFALRGRTRLWWGALFCGAVVVVVYHGLYRLAGNPYSFSAIAGLTQTWVEMVRRMGVSLLAGSLAFLGLLVVRQDSDAVTIIHAGYEMLFFAAIGFLGPALVGFWKIGAAVTWHFPDAPILFYYLTGLWQTVWLIAPGLLIPPVVVLLNAVFKK